MRTFIHLSEDGKINTAILALEDISTIVGPYVGDYTKESYYVITLTNTEIISISKYQYTVVVKALEKKYGISYY